MIRKAILSLALALGLVGVGALQAQPAYALFETAKDDACKGINLNSSGTCPSGTTRLRNVIRTIVNILSIIIGTAAVIMVMVGGFKYITSAGDPGNVSSAKRTIVYAIVGLIVAILSQFLVHFVLTKA